ncbi:cation:proton antiporter [Lacrimispora sp. 210928-DFI.3.58]|uniref:cation:proton antiporter n=1 Tax=Lacrimispora sp. 210928-DFI.3.58 TaxID=2883214 RepID=UPI001D07E445|nr:cation:proton antiporter [Lacrimispora sp. 210928-DFI.3.58]MCB7317380.1 cation:proton antiporter [Lacrimispora sp. 210928-DFI.3.58]
MALFLSDLGTAGVILAITIMLASAFLFTRATKKLHLPNVTGYILAGVAIGPWCLNLIPQEYIKHMDFITDLALAFIAFGVGKYFRLSSLKANGMRMVVLTLFESLTAGILITAAMLLLGLSMPFSLLLGAIGCATAPASTIMTIRQYKAKGPFIDTILQVVALDDAVALIAFSICTAIVQASGTAGSMTLSQVLLPVALNLLSLGAGLFSGILLSRLIHKRRSKDHSLVLACVVIMATAGLCTALNVSPLLACMACGTAYVNSCGNKHLFKQLNQFTPPLLVMFFVLSGMRLSLPSLAQAGMIGVIYFLVRILGKYAGASLGAAVIHASPEIRRYFGLALIPQAGVSIGLAVLGQRMLPGQSGEMLSTIILSSGLLYEMVGPACSKWAIRMSGSIPGSKEKEKKKERKKEKAEKTGKIKEPPVIA